MSGLRRELIDEIERHWVDIQNMMVGVRSLHDRQLHNAVGLAMKKVMVKQAKIRELFYTLTLGDLEE